MPSRSAAAWIVSDHHVADSVKKPQPCSDCFNRVAPFDEFPWRSNALTAWRSPPRFPALIYPMSSPREVVQERRKSSTMARERVAPATRFWWWLLRKPGVPCWSEMHQSKNDCLWGGLNCLSPLPPDCNWKCTACITFNKTNFFSSFLFLAQHVFATQPSSYENASGDTLNIGYICPTQVALFSIQTVFPLQWRMKDIRCAFTQLVTAGWRPSALERAWQWAFLHLWVMLAAGSSNFLPL